MSEDSRVVRIIDTLGSDTAAAEALGIDEEELIRWLHGGELSTAENNTLNNSDKALDLADEAFHPSLIPGWLTGPNPMFGGSNTAWLLRAGHADAVLQDLRRVCEGGYA